MALHTRRFVVRRHCALSYVDIRFHLASVGIQHRRITDVFENRVLVV